MTLRAAAHRSGSARCVVFVALLWLLSDILLPFVAGMALAYLLDPLADRLRAAGPQPRDRVARDRRRSSSCSLVVALIADRAGARRASSPHFVEQHAATMSTGCRRWSPSRARPGSSKLVGEQLPDARQSVSDLVEQGAGWLADVPALALVRRPGAGLGALAARRHAGRRVLPAARLGPHDRDGRRLDAACSIATPCAGSRARSTPRSPASCAARRWSA